MGEMEKNGNGVLNQKKPVSKEGSSGQLLEVVIMITVA
jgi:hypothetical protein